MQMSKERVLITILSAIGVLSAFLLPNGMISAGIGVVLYLLLQKVAFEEIINYFEIFLK